MRVWSLGGEVALALVTDEGEALWAGGIKIASRGGNPDRWSLQASCRPHEPNREARRNHLRRERESGVYVTCSRQSRSCTG